MKCQNCGTEVQEAAKFCLKCGSKIERAPVIEAPAEKKDPTDITNVWPEWQIEKQLGKGSYGVVYQAVRRDNNMETRAAIKVISIPSDASEVDSLRSEGMDLNGTKAYFKDIVDEFVREIRLMDSLKGIQNIVSVEDYKVVQKTDAIGWDIYIRMELLTSFNTYICDRNLTEEAVIKFGTDICTALEMCGKCNIIHRDIKPENIFLNSFGDYKLGDFGIARKLENMTGGLSQKGTLNYMAPEVANGTEYDARVDTYSLGVVLYRLLNNNKLPFLDADKQYITPNERRLAVERRIRGEALPAPCNASPAMADLILRACAHDPGMRFASATEMKQALLRVAKGTYTFSNTAIESTTAVRSAEQDYNATVTQGTATATVTRNVQPEVKPAPEKTKKKNKGKKAKIVIISVLLAVVILAITLAVAFFASSAYSVYTDVKDEEFDDALKEYRSGVKDDFVQEFLLDMLLKNYVSEIATGYENGDVDYDTAIEGLKALDEMGFDGAEDKIEEITVSNDSDVALAKADEYYKNGDYENAISEYSKVPKSNENYKEAQDKLNQVYEDYISEMVKTAKQHNSAKNYKLAVQTVNTAYGILPDTVDKSDLDAVKEESLTAYKTEITNQLTTLIAEEKWSDAFALLDEAVAFDNSTYFQDLKTSTEDNYVKTVTETVQTHLDNSDYIAAKRTVASALAVLPENAALKDLQTKVEKETPVYLLDVYKPYASSGYNEYINGKQMKMGGNAYTNGFTLYNDGNAVFNIEGKYSNLSFLFGHIDGSYMYAATIYIYGDGILLKEVAMQAEDLPQTVSVDITGVKQLKIVQSDSSYPTYGFANVAVK